MHDTSAKVFVIPELLEAILLQLPPRDLLTAQGVNKSFLESVRRSVHIQQKLFFIESPKSNDNVKLVNPFLARLTRLYSGDARPSITSIHEESHSDTSAILGSMIDLPDEVDMAPWEVRADQHVRIRMSGILGDMIEARRVPWKGSCSRMLVSNAPCFFDIQYKYLDSAGHEVHTHYCGIRTQSMEEVLKRIDPDMKCDWCAEN